MRTLLFGLALVVSGCSRTETPPAPSPAPATPVKASKDPAAAKQLIAAGAVVLDVRTPEEFSEGHLPQATNIPVDKVADRVAEVDKLVGGDKAHAVVVYCASGSRAATAKRTLEAAGYSQVVNGGGYDDLE